MLEISVIRAIAPTDGSEVAYTVDGFGYPQAAIVMYDHEPHATIKSHSVGYFDGSRQFTHGLSSTDNSGTTDTFRTSSSSHIVSTGNGVKGSAVRWVDGGIVIDWDAGNTVAGNVVITLIKGVKRAKVFTDTLVFDATEKFIDIGFRPTYLEIAHTCETAGFVSNSVHIFGSRGYIHAAADGTITQACVTTFDQDGVFTGTACGSNLRDDAFAEIAFGSTSAYATCTGVSDTGINYQSNTTQTTRYIGGLAIEFQNHSDVDVRFAQTSVTPTKQIQDIGFYPKYTRATGVKIASLNTFDASANTLTYFDGVADRSHQYCYSLTSQDSVATSNVNQTFGEKLINWNSPTGADETEAHAGLDTSGVNLYFTVVEGVSRDFLLINFGDSTPTKKRGGLFLPSKFVQAPELLIPGRKPRGRVEVDWSHPLARGLVQCFIFNGSNRLDLVNGDVLTLGANTIIGKNLSISGPGGGASVKNRLVTGGAIVCRYISENAVPTEGFYVFDTDPPRDLLLIGTNMFLYASNTAASPVQPYFVFTDDWMTNGVNFGPNEFYSNGLLYRNFSDIASVGGAPTMYIGTRYSWQDELLGEMSYFYVYDRNLTAAEHAAIDKNPYQFLKPAGSAW